MQQSAEVRDAMLRFYDRLSASDVASFDQLVSQEPATLVIGTAPGEWVTERDRMRFGFETEGVPIQAGEPAGYEEGSLGWGRRRANVLLPGRLGHEDPPDRRPASREPDMEAHPHARLGRRARRRGGRAAKALVERFIARQAPERPDRRLQRGKWSP
jgi:hypothetical protein